ncbi:hypothetical protein C8J56DRAFT_937967 [Mycena floridula]|nr:hypothetical protein C8J56DRAFT_937967 [Mycena floridula]
MPVLLLALKLSRFCLRWLALSPSRFWRTQIWFVASGILSLFSARVRSFFVSPSLCPFYITAILSHKRHSDDLDQIIYLTRNDATCIRMDFAFLCAGRYVVRATCHYFSRVVSE